MADEKIVTSIVANSDFSNLIADVQRVTGSLSKLQQEFAGANRALAGQINAANTLFSETMRKTGQFSTHFVSLTSDVEKFGRNLDSGRLKLRDYFRVYQENVKTSGGLVRDLAKQQVQLQNAVLQPLGRNAQGLMQYNVHIPRGLDLTKNKTALLKQELQIMNKVIQDGGVQLINWGKNTQWAGRQLTVGLTLPLAAFGKAAADAFKVADQELTRLTKVYGDVAGTSAQELGKVRKEVSQTAKELSAAMGVSFSETIGLAADIAATGKTGNDLLGSIKETTRLAVLGEVDRQEAMKATLALQSAFKTNTEDLANSINFLNAVENQTSTTLNDLVEAIPKAGPVVKGLGGDVKDLALYLTAMREGGINASEGANALKSALASLINPTDVAVAKFQSFGIDLLGIVQKNAGSTTDTLFALQAALDRLNPLQKQQAIEQLFGKFQYSRLNALFENLGRQGSQTLKVLDLMKASAGELEAVAGRELAQVTESASGRYRRALETLRAELAGVGDQFLDIGTKLINVLNKILDFAQKLPDPIKKILAFGGAFTAIIGPVIMLTGVLANFFGYIIKGLGHFKALFKGAEGFKLLTPEIMAARAASSQLSDEFYSDALAADTLSAAIKKLNNDLKELQINAGTITTTQSLGKAITTVGGTPVGAIGGQRVVDINNPLLGGTGRAAAHINPRDPNNPATIFGLTLQPEPVNRTIGRTPQIFMNERLQDIEGLTTSGGVSTGIVAGEHAKYAALMATLGMQSKQEIQQLKKTIAMGGQVSSDFIATFDDILPITQRLTQNAAAQSAAIVADLQAGKINVEQAKAAIIAANANLEKMLGAEITQYAAATGRTIDLTKAPLIDQPVVDVKGKPNVRGMFRKGIFGKVMSAVGRATGTRTMGGSYSIETTKPRGMITGGPVYMTNGETVPGPNINADVVPAMLTPGEFVLTRGTVDREGADAVQALHEGRATIVPFEANQGGRVPGYFNGGAILRAFAQRSRMIGGLRTPNLRSGSTSGPSTISAAESGVGLTFGQIYRRNAKIYKDPEYMAYGISPTTQGEFLVHAMTPGFLRRTAGLERAGSSVAIPSSRLKDFGISSRSRAPFLQALPSQFVKNTQKFNDALKSGATPNDFRPVSSSDMVSLLLFLKDQGVPPQKAIAIAEAAAIELNSKVASHKGLITENIFGRLVNDASVSALKGRAKGFNRGGRVRGYNRGGSISGRYGYARGVQHRKLGGNILSLLAMLGVPMAGQALGSKIGGAAGSAITTGSYVLPMFMGTGMLRSRTQSPEDIFATRMGLTGNKGGTSIFANIPKFGTALANASTQGNSLVKTISNLLLAVTKFRVGVLAVVTIVAKLVSEWKKWQKGQDQTALQFGMTADAAQKAGLKYTNYTEKLKNAVEAQKLMLTQGRLAYESMASAGTPFNMTIEQYKKLKKEIKDTMSSHIEMLNAVSKKEVPRVAVQLKEQLMAAGLSAEEATKKIYTLLQLSNKASMTTAALSSKAFTKIQTPQDAAVSALESFNFASQFANTKAQANALNTALMAIDNSIQSIFDKNQKAAEKKKQNFDATKELYNAEKTALADISSKMSNQAEIGVEVLNTLAKQDPMIRKIANAQDSVVSLWQKMKVAALGYSGVLSNLNKQQTGMLYTLFSETRAAVEEANKARGGLLEKQWANYESLLAQQKKLLNAAKGEKVQNQINRRDRIKYLEEEIRKINEAADARKDALRQEAEDQDINIEIQKKRLEYQQKLAAGDMAGAAQAQLDLQKAIGTQQRTITERAIEERRAADVAPLQAEIDKLNDEAQNIADNAALASESLESVTAKLNKQKTAIDTFNDAMAAYKVAQELGSKNTKSLAGKLLDAAKSAGISIGKYDDVVAAAEALKKRIDSQVDKALEAKDITVNGGKITINGTSLDLQQGSSANPVQLGNSATTSKINPIKLSGWNGTMGPNSVREMVKAAAIQGGVQAGQYFTMVDENGKTYKFRMREDQNITMVENPYVKKADGGYITGPGTSTSDSIPARLSNGEYVFSSIAVQNAGGAAAVDVMHEYYKNAPRFKDGGPVDTKSIFGMNYVPNTAGAMIGLATRAKGYVERDKNSPISKALTEAIGSVRKDFDLWCGVFINWLAKTVGVALPRATYTPDAFNAFRRMNRLYDTPRPGDIAFFDFDRASGQITDHVGLVTGVTDRTITTIDGNTSSSDPRNGGTVASKVRPWGKWNKSLGIFTRGFGRPSYRTDAGGIDLAPHSAQQRAAEAAKSGSSYIVKKGDTLFDIAKQNNMSLADIFKANPKFLQDAKYNNGRTIFSGTEVNIPKLAGGGYVSTLKLPSYKTGVDYLYSDTIAQLHAKEAVLPADMNPWNPTATNPIGGASYTITNNITAGPDMDIEQIANAVTRKTISSIKQLESVNASKIGINRSI